jgi:hypothetical protein
MIHEVKSSWPTYGVGALLNLPRRRDEFFDSVNKTIDCYLSIPHKIVFLTAALNPYNGSDTYRRQQWVKMMRMRLLRSKGLREENDVYDGFLFPPDVVNWWWLFTASCIVTSQTMSRYLL